LVEVYLVIGAVEAGGVIQAISLGEERVAGASATVN
jgi:hypothetical protein